MNWEQDLYRGGEEKQFNDYSRLNVDAMCASFLCKNLDYIWAVYIFVSIFVWDSIGQKESMQA